MLKAITPLGRAASWFCVIVLGVLSLLPADDIVRTDMGGHVEHVLAYATTALLLIMFHQSLAPMQVFASLSAYAACLEYLQRFSPGRTPSLVDLAFSLTGTAVGLCVFVVGRRAFTSQRPFMRFTRGS